jgi:hypothetical protein
LGWRLRGRGDRLEDQLGDPTGVVFSVKWPPSGIETRVTRATLESGSLVVVEAGVVLVAEHDPRTAAPPSSGPASTT